MARPWKAAFSKPILLLPDRSLVGPNEWCIEARNTGEEYERNGKANYPGKE
jgi:hypothetical protein